MKLNNIQKRPTTGGFPKRRASNAQLYARFILWMLFLAACAAIFYWSATRQPSPRYSVTLYSHGEPRGQWTSRGAPHPHYFKNDHGEHVTWHFTDDKSGAPVAVQSLAGALVIQPMEAR